MQIEIVTPKIIPILLVTFNVDVIEEKSSGKIDKLEDLDLSANIDGDGQEAAT